MFITTARFRPRLPTHQLAFSTSSGAAKGRTAHGPRDDGADPPRNPGNHHERPPHLVALEDRKQLFHTRTSWLARELAEGKPIPPHLLSKILVNRKIPAQDLLLWVDILSTADLYEAMERLGLLESAGEGVETADFPHWLFLLLPAMLKTPEQAPYLASLLGSARYEQLDHPRQGLFAARCIQHFLKVGHYVAVRETVEWICHHQPQLKTARVWKECLEALASHRSDPSALRGPPREMLAALVRKLKVEMTKRGVEPDLDVYRVLFRPWLIPRDPAEAASLVQEMEKGGFWPKSVVLHQAMTVHARAGDVEGTEALGRRIEEGKSSSRGSDKDVKAEDASPTQRQTGVEASTQLLSLGGDVAKAFAFFNRWMQDTTRHSISSNRLSLPDGATWSILFNIIASSSTVPSQDLLAALRKLEKASAAPRDKAADASPPPPRPSLHIYHSVMLGLLRRHDPRLVVNLWVSLRARGIAPDNHILDVVMRAYCALDDFRSALTLIDSFARRPAEASSARPPSSSKALSLDVVILNNLLHHYSHAGLTHNCYRLFLTMPSLYGVSPDATSLAIIVDAARYASAAAGLGYGPGSEAIDVTGMRSSTPDDLWTDESQGGKQEHAWKVAERLCWETLEGNWPEGVERVKDPMEGGGVVGWLLRRNEGSAEDDLPSAPFPATLSVINPPPYPQIYPHERLFRSFVQLLGYHSSPRSIPLVLAWMRYIDIKPTRHTLSLAMLYVGELGLEPRRMARWRRWLEEWLGEEDVPDMDEIAFMRRGGGRAGVPIRR